MDFGCGSCSQRHMCSVHPEGGITSRWMCTTSAFSMGAPETEVSHGYQHVIDLPLFPPLFCTMSSQKSRRHYWKSFPLVIQSHLQPLNKSGLTWTILGKCLSDRWDRQPCTIFSCFLVLPYLYIEKDFPNTQSKPPLLPFKLNTPCRLSSGFWRIDCPLKLPLMYLNAVVMCLITLFKTKQC